ncbi:Periplasmic binding protein [uncultured archaeon]|nr:Periplasmic binding protein [uncultured archaeon]
MKKIILLACVVLTITLLFGCTQSKTTEIGFIGILTGQGSAWGEAAKNGATLAVEEINANGGVNGKLLSIDYQDDEGEVTKTITAFNYLTETKGDKIIIGPTWSNNGLPLIKLADEKKVLMISPSLGKPEFNEGSKYLFNTWPHDVALSSALADYVYDKGHTHVALIGAEEVWVKDQTNAFRKRFTELGGIVDVLIEPTPEQTEVRAEATKIKNAKNITAIVSVTDGVLVGALVAKKTKELGVELPIYSVTIDSDAIKSAQGAYEEMEFLTFLTPTAKFKEKYEKRFGSIDVGADSAYDAVMLLAAAMLETKSSDSTVLAEYLQNVKEYNGTSGHLISDGNRAFTKPFLAKKVLNGVMVDLNA